MPPRDVHGVVIGDWELLFDAAMARLRSLVDSMTATAPLATHASPVSTGSLHDDLIDCAAALDQLHATMTRERAACQLRVAALFDAPASDACGRGHAAPCARAHAVAACLACAARPPAA